MKFHLNEQLFHLLSTLRGVYVSHRTISDCLWSCTEAPEAKLRQQVRRLRKRLADHMEIDSRLTGHYRLLGYQPEPLHPDVGWDELWQALKLVYGCHVMLPTSFLSPTVDGENRPHEALWLETVVMSHHEGRPDPTMSVPIGFAASDPPSTNGPFNDMGILEVAGQYFLAHYPGSTCAEASHRNLLMPQVGMFHGHPDGLREGVANGLLFSRSGAYVSLEWITERNATTEVGAQHPR